LSASSYSKSDRALHGLALGIRSVAELSFDLEQKTQHPDGEATKNNTHVFIAGLARAGTTVLMRRLYASGCFGSLTYRDMPFVLAPGLWSKLSRHGQRQTVLAERAHGDGLMVDTDSPESLDEVFWRVYCGENYIEKNALVPHDPDESTLNAFRTYIAAILQSRKGNVERYLSKTNNSILRISGLRSAFPNALILVPFRTPFQHAHSLLRQHKLFKEEQNEDRFVLKYMNWLAHHEFGEGHRPFVFDNNSPQGDPDTLAYWVELWCGVYEALLARHKTDVIFVSYDSMCTDPSLWPKLVTYTGLQDYDKDVEALRHATHAVSESIPPRLSDRANRLHEQLQSIQFG